ncbi:MAG: glycosyltransferase family 4 protein, partial [Actinomycetota bacterium]|nr:glycosyltransferase family 4 protein [Actinomycetota bacterium]
VSVFPNPVDQSAFPALSREQRAAFREELGVPGGVRVLLHFGRDWQIKDGDIFLDALGVLVNEGRSVIGLINQGGEEAASAAARRGLEQQVKLTGLLPQPQKLYGAADVMVASSRGEGMPYTVAEALCSGVPVVASDLAGHRYLGDELEACSIVPRDAGRFASAAEAFLDMDADETARLCATAREWIVERLDVGAAAARLVDQYEQTIRDSSTQPQVGSS